MLRFAAAAFALFAFSAPASAQGKPAAKDDEVQHRLVIHVDDNDKQKMELALNNAANVSKAYAEKGEEVEVEIVVYGPGLHMFRTDTSPIKERIQSFRQSMPNVAFSACGNTIHTMEKQSGKKVVLFPKIRVVPAGVTRIMELQEQGWSYIKP